MLNNFSFRKVFYDETFENQYKFKSFSLKELLSKPGQFLRSQSDFLHFVNYNVNLIIDNDGFFNDHLVNKT